jgi:hypothetical protein
MKPARSLHGCKLADGTGVAIPVVTFAAILIHNVPPIPLMAAGALIGLMTWASTALAYRPFDSTDADVATAGEFELELGPLGRVEEGSRRLNVAPAVVANFGLSHEHELVIEGRRQRSLDSQPGENSTAIVDTGVFIKQVLREGVLQDKAGLSVATEYGLLLPTWRAENGTGLSVAGIVSQRSAMETLHVNAAVGVARNHQPSTFLGAILEGPYEWELRPVTEIFREQTRGDPRTDSVLVGAIWRKRKDLSFDVGLRAARQGDEAIHELRLGFTWTFSMKGS